MVSWFQSCTTQVSAISPNGVNFSLKTYRLLASMLPETTKSPIFRTIADSRDGEQVVVIDLLRPKHRAARCGGDRLVDGIDGNQRIALQRAVRLRESVLPVGGVRR